MKIAELLITELKGRGIPCIYALCGNGLDPILDASHDGDMRIIDVRNEQAAAYMADAAGRLTRRIGVAAVSSGIAHMNALTGICNAWYDGSPMLLITGASESAYRKRGNFQDMETADIAKPLCKYSDFVDRPERLIPALDAAIAHATTGRPGPVHLTIPLDVLTAEIEISTSSHATGDTLVTGSGLCGEQAIIAARRLIDESKRPLIIAGSGVYYAEAASELEGLAASIEAPAMTPIWDRGVVDRPFPNYCGVIGAASGSPDLLSEADLILLVGAEVDYRIGYLDPPARSADAKIVRIEIDPSQMYEGVTPDIALHGDPRSVMGQLLEALADGDQPNRGQWMAQATSRRDAFYRQFTQLPASTGCTGGDVVRMLEPAITKETFMLVDGGNIGQWFHMLIHDRYPQKWMTCGRSAVVGWGFPSAAAVSSLNPGQRVLLLSGDGSATFTIAEIEAAVRQNLPYVAVIADDSAWGIVVSGSRKRNVPPVASKLSQIRFDEVARGFGARGIRVDGISTLTEEIENGFASGQVTVIHVPIITGGPADSL